MDCPVRDKCYRATAKPDYFNQRYEKFSFTLIDNKIGCLGYYKTPLIKSAM